MDIDEFLQGTASRVGYMVAVRGRHAPTFVHVGETADDARKAAITEAKRLLCMDGCGRALVLRLEAVVDQPSAVLPDPTIRSAGPVTVEFPLDEVVRIGLKLAKISELEAKLAKHANVEPAPEPIKVGDAVRATEADGYAHDEIVSGCEKNAFGWRVSFVGGGWSDAQNVAPSTGEA